jgi:hypothetical protein
VDSDRIPRVPPYSGYCYQLPIVTCTGLSPSMIELSSSLPLPIDIKCRSPTTPALPKQYWFGLFPVRSPLLRESLIIFFSYGYLDVSVPRVSLISNNISSICWVAPFGNLRFNSYLHFTVAYRSLSRPSSPLRA